jgi:hypothetical protein
MISETQFGVCLRLREDQGLLFTNLVTKADNNRPSVHNDGLSSLSTREHRI